MPSDLRGVAAIMTASFGFSWGFIIVRAVGLPPAWTALFRLAIGASVLLSFALTRRMRLVPSWPVVVAGLLFGLHQLLFIEASQVTSIALVSLIGALQPLIVASISQRALGERVPRVLYLCALLALCGVGVVVFANRKLPSTSLYGLALCLLDVLTFTAFFLASKRARLFGAHPVPLTGISVAIALLPIVPFLPYESPGDIEARQVGLLAVMALLPGNGHLLVNWAHPRVSAILGSLILGLVPVFASIWAHLLFGEPYGPLHVLGTVLCVAAVEIGRRGIA